MSRAQTKLGAGIWWQQIEAGNDKCHWDTTTAMTVSERVCLTTAKSSMMVTQALLALFNVLYTNTDPP